VHCGGQAAWWHLSREFPDMARPHVRGPLLRFVFLEEALIGYVKEYHLNAPILVPTHLLQASPGVPFAGRVKPGLLGLLWVG
jgi:hypothetical protein